ncbi:MAG: family esterase protein [Candidatus Eremiobacteraeota bacterium]|nr:family esterase protein [Candidatus Eremiobacteraeota bacterium]
MLNGFIPGVWPSRLPNQGSYATSGTNLGGTARHAYKVMRSGAGVKLRFANFYPNQGGSDLGVPANAGPITIQAVAEYPIDTFWPVFFNGQPSITLQLGAFIDSDELGIEVNGGDNFFAKTDVQAPNPGAIPIGCFSGNIDGEITSGGGVTFAIDGTQSGDNYPSHNAGAGTNQLLTTGQAWVTAAGQFSFGPTEILIRPTSNLLVPVIAHFGDSILDGSIDDGHDFGFAMRAAVRDGYSYKRLCRGGENGVLPSQGSWQRAAGHFVRASLAQGCTHVIWEYGTNDLAGGTTTWAAFQPAVLAAWKQVARHFPSAPLFATTITPRVNGIGSNAAAQSTINAGYFSTSQSYNAWLRAPLSAGAGNSAAFDCIANGILFGGCIDVASFVETNSANAVPGGPSNPNLGGLWWCGAGNNSSGVTAFGADGVHPSKTGHLAIMSALTASMFALPAGAVGNGSAPAAVGNG